MMIPSMMPMSSINSLKRRQQDNSELRKRLEQSHTNKMAKKKSKSKAER